MGLYVLLFCEVDNNRAAGHLTGMREIQSGMKTDTHVASASQEVHRKSLVWLPVLFFSSPSPHVHSSGRATQVKVSSVEMNERRPGEGPTLHSYNCPLGCNKVVLNRIE